MNQNFFTRILLTICGKSVLPSVSLNLLEFLNIFPFFSSHPLFMKRYALV